MFRLQPVMAGVGPVDSLHGGSCLDEKGGLRGGDFEVGYGSFHVITSSLDSKK